MGIEAPKRSIGGLRPAPARAAAFVGHAPYGGKLNAGQFSANTRLGGGARCSQPVTGGGGAASNHRPKRSLAFLLRFSYLSSTPELSHEIPVAYPYPRPRPTRQLLPGPHGYPARSHDIGANGALPAPSFPTNHHPPPNRNSGHQIGTNRPFSGDQAKSPRPAKCRSHGPKASSGHRWRDQAARPAWSSDPSIAASTW